MVERIGWATLRQRSALLVGIAVLLAALLRPVPSFFLHRNGGDCVRYRDWSRLVVKEGMPAFPMLMNEWKQKWVGFPPPTRWTWLAMIAGLMKIWPSGHDEYQPIVLLAWLGGVLALVPLGLWLRRLVQPEVVALALGLVALSPLLRGMSKYPLPDSLQMSSTMWLVYLTSEWAHAPRRWLLWAQGAAAFLLITVRETGLLSIVAAMALALYYARRPTEAMAARATRTRLWPIAAMLGGCVVAAASTVVVCGGWETLWSLVVVYVGALVKTGNIAFVSGPPYRYLVDFVIVAPLVVVLAVAGLTRMLGQERWRALTAPLGLVLGVLFSTNAFLPKTLRYVLAVDVLLRVLVAALLYDVYVEGGRRARRVAIGLGIAVVLVDEALWYKLWAFDQVYDPVTWSLARQLQMIPR